MEATLPTDATQAQRLALHPQSTLRSSYRSDFCLRHEMRAASAPSLTGLLGDDLGLGSTPRSPTSPTSQFGKCMPTSPVATMTAFHPTSPTTMLRGQDDGDDTMMTSTFTSSYGLMCHDRNTVNGKQPHGKSNKQRVMETAIKRHRSLVPLGSSDPNSTIHAPISWIPFDTKGQVSGRGGLTDEEIMAYGKPLCVHPHPATQLNAHKSFTAFADHPGNTKSMNQITFHSGLHARTSRARMGGHGYWKPGDKSWHTCKSHAAFELGVHSWPREQPQVARLSSVERLERSSSSTLGGRTVVFGRDLQSFQEEPIERWASSTLASHHGARRNLTTPLPD
eukprot:TRINITY_DN77441_c0_g1_i1.p1 TRINITY_DN77441_c0_g1~~TRINITY_DN77441_c0_g1_i1.p1  ORF type:complete len:336 (+),score=28.18 TRINITY_DN77441_c0_g1_i1:51-1058(+)